MNDVIGVGKKLNSAKSSSRVMVMCGRSADSWYASTILQGGVVLGWRRNSATGRLFNSEFTHCFVQSGLRLFPSSRDGLSGQDIASGTLFTCRFSMDHFVADCLETEAWLLCRTPVTKDF